MSLPPSPDRQTARERFPYEQLLAFYRDQIDDEALRRQIERSIAEDPRWRVHWESIRYLDLERDSARSDGNQLKTFPAAPVSDFTEAVAETDGDVLLALFGDTAPDQIAGHTPAEWRDYLSACPYGRRMRRWAYAAHQRRAAGLPANEKLLGDWLLEHYYADELERITQTVALAVSLRRAGQVDELSPGAEGLLGLNEALVSGLQEALARPRPQRASALYETIYNDDPLYATAAGEEENVVWASPLWFTWLPEAPRAISWDPGGRPGPWRMRVWNAEGKIIAEETVHQPQFATGDEVAKRFAEEQDVRWEVQPLQPPGSLSLVCGVFRVLAAGRSQGVQGQLTKIAAGPPGINRDLAVAQCHCAAGLFDAAIRHLRLLEKRYERGTASFLVHRGLATVLLAVSRELTGARGLGRREGLWATNLASRSLATAYGALGIAYQGE